MTDSLHSLQHAIGAFGDRMGDTHLLPLLIALALHLASLLVRSGVWCGILRAAFPGNQVRYRDATAAYVTGAGANAVAPLRGGDLIRIYSVRRFVPGAPYATIISTLIAETVFGAVVIAALAAFTVGMGWLPPLVRLPDRKAFDPTGKNAREVFDPGMIAAFREDARLAKGEVGFVDADPVCQCQDDSGLVAKLVSVTMTGPGAADAVVNLQYPNETVALTLHLVPVNGAWRVHDLSTGEVKSYLAALLKANKEAAAQLH